MEFRGKSIVVTGAASGIGRAMAVAFSQLDPRALTLLDVNEVGLREVGEATGAAWHVCDLGEESAVTATLNDIEDRCAGIDLYCGNAGILYYGGFETPTDAFQRVMDINVMSHVHAIRTLLPGMVNRGSGHVLITASAAGLLTQLGSLSYAVSKHAALAVAEWLAASYADRGIRASALCPQAVATAMTADTDGGSVAGIDGMLQPDEVAQAVIEGLQQDRFLILPHPQVKQYFLNKAENYDRWVGGMAKLQRQFAELRPVFPDG